MKCPLCKSDTRVINTRERSSLVWRRRKCIECGHTFGTKEHDESRLNLLILERLRRVKQLARELTRELEAAEIKLMSPERERLLQQ